MKWEELACDFIASTEFGDYQVCVCGPSATFMSPDAVWHGVGQGWTEAEAKAAAESHFRLRKVIHVRDLIPDRRTEFI